MNINEFLVPYESRITGALAKVKQYLAESLPCDALKVITDIERAQDMKSVEDWHKSNADLLPRDQVVSWCYCHGVCLGMLERHAEALATALELGRLFPGFPEGCYLAGMATAAQKDFDRSRAFFEDARKLDEARRGLEKSKTTSRQIASRIKELQHDHIRRIIRRHADLVQSVAPNPCTKCGFQSSLPTPRWACPRCFTQEGVEVAIWQPDSVGVCHACNSSIGSGARHHCRSCGKLCCASCSTHSSLVSLLGYHDAPVRICDTCYHRVVDGRGEILIHHKRDEQNAQRLSGDRADIDESIDDDRISTRSSAYSVCNATIDEQGEC
jgi:predicted Zn-ribbon and HTH transcriptional regulator